MRAPHPHPDPLPQAGEGEVGRDLDFNTLSGYGAAIDVRPITRLRVLKTQGEEAFRTDSGLATAGRST
jgi:hypothetical protein